MGKGRLLEQVPVYSDRCIDLLQCALDMAVEAEFENNESQPSSCQPLAIPLRYASSGDEFEEAEKSSSSESEAMSAEEDDHTTTTDAIQQNVTVPNKVDASKGDVGVDISKETKQQRRNKKVHTTLDQRQRDLAVRKYLDLLPCLEFILSKRLELDKPEQVLEVPIALLSKDVASSSSEVLKCQAFLTLAKNIGCDKPVIVLFLRSGRFAGGVFVGNTCIDHTTSVRYTVRKGQGKAQSTQDGQRRAKSIGSQLRRQGEIQLQEDVQSTLLRWDDSIRHATLLLVSVAKTMKKTLFEGDHSLKRDDPRIRRVPLDLGRPSFENVFIIHSVLTSAVVRERISQQSIVEEDVESTVARLEVSVVGSNDIETNHTPEIVPLSKIHVACQMGDDEAIREIIEQSVDDKEMVSILNRKAGESLMTPLHYAAESSTTVSPEKAAKCVLLLLNTGHADPCLIDTRSRVPYFLASHDKVRNAFRIARAMLGEDFCEWDKAAKIGAPLTQDTIEQKKEREAERKRRKRNRLKETKAKEKLEQIEAEKLRKETEERQQQEAEAKRVRDGLQPKQIGGGICDFCQTECKGRKRTQMYKRLGYSYCSTDCVDKHKRELMAAAALARLQGL